KYFVLSLDCLLVSPKAFKRGCAKISANHCNRWNRDAGWLYYALPHHRNVECERVNYADSRKYGSFFIYSSNAVNFARGFYEIRSVSVSYLVTKCDGSPN